MAYRADEVKVGFVLVISVLILAGFIVAILGLRVGRETVFYSTSLKYVAGVDPGRPVRFGGLKVGKVAKTEISPVDTSHIKVTLEVDKGVPIKTDSEAYINIIGFVSDYYIEISTGTEDAPLLPPGSEIPGRSVATFNEMIAQAETAIAQVNDSLRIINQEVLTEEVPQLQQKILEMTENMNKLLRDLDLVVEDNSIAVKQTVDEVNQLVTANRPDIEQTVQNFHAASQKLRSLADSLEGLVAENRQGVNTVVDNIRVTAAEARDVADKLDTLISQNADNVTATVENVRATSDNARNLSEDLVEQPWRLLWRTKPPERQVIEEGK